MEQFECMGDVGPDFTDKTRWADAKNITLDSTLPKGRRMELYLKEINTPYRFRCGETGIKVEFAPDAPSLQELLMRHCMQQKSERRL